MNVLLKRLRENVVPRRLLGWAWHLAGVFLCWWLAFLLRFDFQTGHPLFSVFYPTAWMAAAVFVVSIAAFRPLPGGCGGSSRFGSVLLRRWPFLSARWCLRGSSLSGGISASRLSAVGSVHQLSPHPLLGNWWQGHGAAVSGLAYRASDGKAACWRVKAGGRNRAGG